MNMSEDEYRLCVRVAKLYYEQDLTQNEIAQRLGYSRVKINRVLKQARDSGIAEIRINAPENFYFDLETELISRFDLRDAFIVMDEPPGNELLLALAEGVNTWLNQHIKTGIRIGVGLGRTISYLPRVFNVKQPVDCTFVEIVGAASNHTGGIGAYNITSKLADLAGGKAQFFYAPTFVSTPELKQNLLNEPSVQVAIQNARSVDVAIQSVGPVDDSALLFVHKYIDRNMLNTLKKLGAVGDALGHYYDISGNPVLSPVDDQVIGLELEDLRKIPWSVLVAGGKEKIIPIYAALEGKYFNVLITNFSTATALLNKDGYHA